MDWLTNLYFDKMRKKKKFRNNELYTVSILTDCLLTIDASKLEIHTFLDRLNKHIMSFPYINSHFATRSVLLWAIACRQTNEYTPYDYIKREIEGPLGFFLTTCETEVNT